MGGILHAQHACYMPAAAHCLPAQAEFAAKDLAKFALRHNEPGIVPAVLYAGCC